MKKNQFKKLLVRYLKEEYGDAYEAAVTYTAVNNGAGHECLSFRKKGVDHMITIGISNLFELFKNDGESMEIIGWKVMEYYTSFTEAAKNASGGDLDSLKEHIYCRLINYEMNRNKLRSVPHEKRLDMAVVYYYRLNLTEEENAGVIIDYEKFADRKYESQIREAAWGNTLRGEQPVFSLLSEMIGGYPGSDLPLYVVTNQDRYYGAICIFYPGLLKKIAAQLDSDLYIIPSSIHECLVLPVGCIDSGRSLREMVHTINRAELDRDEILSDSVYYYNLKNDSISIDI